MEWYQMLLIAVIAFGASFVQSTTGFGFGIVAMIFLPNLLLYTEANVLSTALSVFTSSVVVVTMFRLTSWRNLLFPILGSVLSNYLAVSFLKSAKNDLLMLMLGIALFLLSIYFFFFSGKIKIRPTWYAGLIAGVISGAMNGLFSIGGPPVVIYYLQSEEDTDHYLATISAYFVLSGLFSVGMKAAAGFVTANVGMGLLLGIVGMLGGALVGRGIRRATKPKWIRKAVYGVMAVSGLINVVTSVISLCEKG